FARLGANYFTYNKNYNSGSIQYKAKLTLLTAPLMLDYHPIENSGFRLSAGIAYNGNKIKATARPISNVTLNGRVYRPQQIGSVTADLKLGSNIGGIVA